LGKSVKPRRSTICHSKVPRPFHSHTHPVIPVIRRAWSKRTTTTKTKTCKVYSKLVLPQSTLIMADEENSESTIVDLHEGDQQYLTCSNNNNRYVKDRNSTSEELQNPGPKS